MNLRQSLTLILIGLLVVLGILIVSGAFNTIQGGLSKRIDWNEDRSYIIFALRIGEDNYYVKSSNAVIKNGELFYRDEAKVEKVKQLISSTNFNKLASNKYTGVCPPPGDSQERIYTFYLDELGEKKHVIRSCEHEIPQNDLFSFIDNIVNKK